MLDRIRTGLFTSLIGLFIAGAACTAGDMPQAKVKIGERAPDFALADADGKQWSLSDFAGKKAVAVIFIATQCPYSKAFDHVMANLAKEYANRGVTFVAINSNKTEPAAEVAEHARKNGFTFPVLKDKGNVIADQYGASVTPEVFLLDSDFNLRYHGALGNSAKPTTNAEEATDAEFRPALDALLAGQTIARAETKAFGCTIKRI
jgi:peroxiredoxin